MDFDSLETVKKNAEISWEKYKKEIYDNSDRFKIPYILGQLSACYERMYNDLPESKKRINQPEKINENDN